MRSENFVAASKSDGLHDPADVGRGHARRLVCAPRQDGRRTSSFHPMHIALVGLDFSRPELRLLRFSLALEGLGRPPSERADLFYLHARHHGLGIFLQPSQVQLAMERLAGQQLSLIHISETTRTY